MANAKVTRILVNSCIRLTLNSKEVILQEFLSELVTLAALLVNKHFGPANAPVKQKSPKELLRGKKLSSASKPPRV